MNVLFICKRCSSPISSSFPRNAPLRLLKDVLEEVSETLKKMKSTINCKLIEERQNDKYKKYSVFEDLQDGIKQKSVTFKDYDLAF